MQLNKRLKERQEEEEGFRSRSENRRQSGRVLRESLKTSDHDDDVDLEKGLKASPLAYRRAGPHDSE